jgi:hypothetical protein
MLNYRGIRRCPIIPVVPQPPVPPTPVVLDSQSVYVNSLSGNNTTGVVGAALYPFADTTFAINAVQPPPTATSRLNVILAPGAYSEVVTLPAYVDLTGDVGLHTTLMLPVTLNSLDNQLRYLNIPAGLTINSGASLVSHSVINGVGIPAVVVNLTNDTLANIRLDNNTYNYVQNATTVNTVILVNRAGYTTNASTVSVNGGTVNVSTTVTAPGLVSILDTATLNALTFAFFTYVTIINVTANYNQTSGYYLTSALTSPVLSKAVISNSDFGVSTANLGTFNSFPPTTASVASGYTLGPSYTGVNSSAVVNTSNLTFTATSSVVTGTTARTDSVTSRSTATNIIYNNLAGVNNVLYPNATTSYLDPAMTTINSRTIGVPLPPNSPTSQTIQLTSNDFNVYLRYPGGIATTIVMPLNPAPNTVLVIQNQNNNSTGAATLTTADGTTISPTIIQPGQLLSFSFMAMTNSWVVIAHQP